MGHYADRLNGVLPSQTKAMTQRARELKAAGKDVIVLSQGEPDFETPDHIKAAGVRAILEGKTRYTAVPGILPLREAISRKLEVENSLSYSADDITVGTGAKQILANALLATLSTGQEVIFPAPCWTSYPDMIRIAGGKPVRVDCSETGFKLTPDALEAALTPRTRWLMLNSPSNPTGAVYSRGDLSELARVLRNWPDVWVLSDDIYEHLVYDGDGFVTLAQVAPDLKDRILTVNGVSKSHAMTGWRIGYGAGPAELIKKMNLLQSQMTSHACSIAQYAALEALDGPDDHLQIFREAFQQRRDFVWNKLKEIPVIEAGARPEGAFYLFAGCKGVMGARTPMGDVIGNDLDFATYLLETARVAVTPGSAFLASPFIRISYASSLDELKFACDRITKACSALDTVEPGV